MDPAKTVCRLDPFKSTHHDEIVNPPPVRIPELPLGGVGKQCVDQGTAFLLRRPQNASGMGGDVKRLAPDLRNRTYHHLGHGTGSGLQRHRFSI